MKFSTSVIAAVSVLLPAVQAHTYMSVPNPMGGNRDNSPLEPDGSNFPCKMIADGESVKTYTPGVDDFFEITGSAVHGGGSCQISVTYDETPTKDSVFKVVQSYEGSCPVNRPEGNYASDPTRYLPKIPVKFPVGLKSGKAVFAWTWFNKIGNREMYMNCARITIGGSSSSDQVFNSLPDMFVANINLPQSQCTTPEGVDIQFPDAGNNVIVSNDKGINLGPACNSYKNLPPKKPTSIPQISSSMPTYGATQHSSPMPTYGATQHSSSMPTYSVTSRPAFVGNPDQAMPTATTLKPAPMPSSKSPYGGNSNNNGKMNGNDNGESGKNGSDSENTAPGNPVTGGSNNNNKNSNNTNGLNIWGAKHCTDRGSRICNADRKTFSWCDENGSLWESEPCPLRTTCIPGKDISIVPPKGTGEHYRRHLASHNRRSFHHH